MISSLLFAIEHFFGSSLSGWAGTARAGVLLLYGTAWAVPPALWWLRRRRVRPALLLVTYWICSCGQSNVLTLDVCSRCAKGKPAGWKERLAASRFGKIVKGMRLFWLSLGWGSYYALSFLALGAVDAWRGGPALRVLLSSAAALCGLGGIVLAGRTLSRRGGGPLDRFFSFLGAGAMTGFFALFAALWAAAPFPPSKPLAEVRLLANGRVQFETPDGRRLARAGIVKDGRVELRVRTAVVVWPLFQVRQTVPLSVGKEPLAAPWVERLVEYGARNMTIDQPHRLRVSLREESLFGRPGETYSLREASDGAGLLLTEITP